MRHEPVLRLDAYRRDHPTLGGSHQGSNWGYFNIGRLCVFSSGDTDDKPESHGWEHVSVSLPDRCPTWDEMALVKKLFWTDEETVIQFHPPKDKHINRHPFCLHLWRKPDRESELPPAILIG